MPGAVALPPTSWTAGCRATMEVTPHRMERVAREVAFSYNPQGLKYSPKSNRESKGKRSANMAPV